MKASESVSVKSWRTYERVRSMRMKLSKIRMKRSKVAE